MNLHRASCLLYFAIFTLPAAMLAQSFDVASIRLHDRGDRNFSAPTCTSGRFVSRALPVSELLAWAYDLRSDQALALHDTLPAWARMDLYDIQATAGKPAPDVDCKRMVQQLFASRFRMMSHWKRLTNTPGYELTVAPKGHKLKPVTPSDTGCGVHISHQGQERPCDRYQWPLAPKRAMTMDEFARVLTIYKSSSPVINRTGLTGEFKINLSFTTRSDDPQYPSMETALQEQLGLVLRQSKGDVDILVVDSIERPTAN
jgi:uncharacterized protein (TIGR03435 family)